MRFYAGSEFLPWQRESIGVTTWDTCTCRWTLETGGLSMQVSLYDLLRTIPRGSHEFKDNSTLENFLKTKALHDHFSSYSSFRKKIIQTRHLATEKMRQWDYFCTCNISVLFTKIWKLCRRNDRRKTKQVSGRTPATEKQQDTWLRRKWDNVTIFVWSRQFFVKTLHVNIWKLCRRSDQKPQVSGRTPVNLESRCRVSNFRFDGNIKILLLNTAWRS